MPKLRKVNGERGWYSTVYYKGIGPEEGISVNEGDAYAYALERCLGGTLKEQKEFREMLVEWYYSGNWIKEE